MRPKILRVSNVVLLLLCLMYFLTYLARANIITDVGSDQFQTWEAYRAKQSLGEGNSK